MSTLSFRDCEDCGDVVKQYPLFAGSVAVLLGALTYAGLSVAVYGSVDLIETGVFAVVFGVGYTSTNYLWRSREPL